MRIMVCGIGMVTTTSRIRTPISALDLYGNKINLFKINVVMCPQLLLKKYYKRID